MIIKADQILHKAILEIILINKCIESKKNTTTNKTTQNI